MDDAIVSIDLQNNGESFNLEFINECRSFYNVLINLFGENAIKKVPSVKVGQNLDFPTYNQIAILLSQLNTYSPLGAVVISLLSLIISLFNKGNKLSGTVTIDKSITININENEIKNILKHSQELQKITTNKDILLFLPNGAIYNNSLNKNDSI